MKILYVSEQLLGLGGWAAVTDEPVIAVPADQVPTQAQLRDADILCVLGQMGNPARARQMGGMINLVLAEGLTVLIGYPAIVEVGLAGFIDVVADTSTLRHGTARDVVEAHPAFSDYFAVFGQSMDFFGDTEGAEVIGSILHPDTAELMPVALATPRGAGVVYIVPYFFGGAEAQFIPMLFDAVLAHRDGSVTATPAFLATLRLPGEQDALDQIAAQESALAESREQARRLERFRHLVGRASGSALEVLVIETLNVILDGTGVQAEDREDVRTEDFWLVGPDGDAALAEVKGQNTHIRRDDVNQVDSHRDELGPSAENLPGLLIVNVFRGYSGLDQRQLPVADQAVRRAASSNVLVMRTIDLYNLLSQAMDGRDAGSTFVGALGQGGGWLEVSADSHELHRT